MLPCSRTILSTLLLLIYPATAGALGFTEPGDAGDLAPGEIVLGSGALDFIDGFFHAGVDPDVDLFLIRITSPASFSAHVNSTEDSQLFLFFASGAMNGVGIAGNDDDSSLPSGVSLGLGTNAHLPVGNALYSGLAAGNYFLGISLFDVDPHDGDACCPMFDTSDVNGIFLPLSSSLVVSNWNVAGGSALNANVPYRITLTGAAFVPEPTTALLVGLGLLATLGFARRMRRR